jgi:hypothetical protein
MAATKQNTPYLKYILKTKKQSHTVKNYSTSPQTLLTESAK